MAGGSQIIINKNGITFITPGKFEAKAGQHLFKSGSKVKYTLPELPNIKRPYSNKLDVYNLFQADNFENLEYSLLFESGQVKKGVIDSYGRTERIKSDKNEKVKVLVGGDDWHYYVSQLGGTKEDEVNVKFLDFVGNPISKLKIQIKDENDKLILERLTDPNGEFSFTSSSDELPVLYVNNILTDTMKPIARINNDNIREIIFISPKVLEEIELFSESDQSGSYLRGTYTTENNDTLDSISQKYGTSNEVLIALNEFLIDASKDQKIGAGILIKLPFQAVRKK